MAAQKHQNFGVISENCGYLRIVTRYRRSENGVVDCNHSGTWRHVMATKFGEFWSTNGEK